MSIYQYAIFFCEDLRRIPANSMQVSRSVSSLWSHICRTLRKCSDNIRGASFIEVDSLVRSHCFRGRHSCRACQQSISEAITSCPNSYLPSRPPQSEFVQIFSISLSMDSNADVFAVKSYILICSGVRNLCASMHKFANCALLQIHSTLCWH
jgi:hypothetical protein